MSEQIDVEAALRGETIFVTGGTGFIGKVLVEKLLWSVPDVGSLVLLVRGGAGGSAAVRFRDQILAAPPLARLRARHGSSWREWAEAKVTVVEGDLARERFGLAAADYADLCRRVDRVVACAATVTFDERLDRAFEVNVGGARRTLALARDAGGVPLVHLSTCFVSGRRRGWVGESPVEMGDGFDLDATLETLEASCRGGSGDEAAGERAARRHGFHDVYTLTKALAERVVTRERGGVPLAILRPAIVESALAEPLAGWIETVRVVDPLLVAYGRGRLRRIPGAADQAVELVPVDLVANAAVAALASLPRQTDGDAGPPRIHQVGSARNPVTLGALMTHAREGFLRTPLRRGDGEPVVPGPARFVAPDLLRRRLEGRQRWLRRALALCDRLPGRWRRRLAPRLGSARRAMEHVLRLLHVYRPYLEHGAHYRDDATQALWRRLSPASRRRFPFDVAAVEWPRYLAEVHVPGLVRHALRAESGAPVPESASTAAPRLDEAAARARSATNLFDLLAGVAEAHPDAVAFQTHRDGRWLRYTYGQALAATAGVARRLSADHGVGRGDRVVLWGGGSPEWVLTAFAVFRLGGTVVPLDPQWPAEEVARAVELVGAKVVCSAPSLLSAAAGVGGLPCVALAAPLVPEPGVHPPAGDGLAGDALTAEDVAEDDPATILFTSGTTVAPKAVPLTHGNYLSNVRDLVPVMELTGERLLSVLPVHHAFEQTVGLLVPLTGASTISYVAEVRPEEIRWMMSTTRPTVLVAVPRLLELLDGGIRASVAAGGKPLRWLFAVLFTLSRLTGGRYGHLLFGKVHRRFGGSLRRIATGGSALDPDLGRRFLWMGFRVAEGYGMTETSPVLTVNPWRALRFGSVGRPLPGVEVELRPPPPDAAGVEPGAGEVWVRGGNVMAGYLGDAAGSAEGRDGVLRDEVLRDEVLRDEVLRDGWLNTGDIGYFDADGYLHLCGRSKEVIVTAAGKNVYPEEVELRYRDLPGVEELVVLGLPREGGGEEVAAVVVPSPGADGGDETAVAAIRDAVARRSAEIPSYQRVTRLEIWHGELPKTTTLKVRRAELRAVLLAGERGAGEPATGPSEGAAPAPPRGGEHAWLVDLVARLTRARPDRISAASRLDELGVDSLTRAELVGAVETRCGRRLADGEVSSLDRFGDLLALLEGDGGEGGEMDRR